MGFEVAVAQRRELGDQPGVPGSAAEELTTGGLVARIIRGQRDAPPLYSGLSRRPCRRNSGEKRLLNQLFQEAGVDHPAAVPCP